MCAQRYARVATCVSCVHVYVHNVHAGTHRRVIYVCVLCMCVHVKLCVCADHACAIDQKKPLFLLES